MMLFGKGGRRIIMLSCGILVVVILIMILGMGRGGWRGLENTVFGKNSLIFFFFFNNSNSFFLFSLFH